MSIHLRNLAVAVLVLCLLAVVPARAEDYDLVNATLGFLIFDQLFYYLVSE